jgi:quinoprotein glucose dehydrogenase
MPTRLSLPLVALISLLGFAACGDSERIRFGEAQPLDKSASSVTTTDAAGAEVEAKAKEPLGPWKPDVKPASPAAERAMAAFEMEDGLSIRLVAAEPLLANPVGMGIDHLGRIYIAECHRCNSGGCADNRDYSYWVDDDLAAMTVEDRRAFTLKHHPEYAEEWTRGSEYVRMLVDEDGDGAMDRSTVFSDRHNDLLSGTAADCFFHEGKVWFACIPHMWRLEDKDGDGVAEEAEKLFSGFGVRYALRGHDLHGMVQGPDGRIYFSIGDRGYHVLTKEGKTLAAAHTGAVFRCEPDGRDLEIFATGLRNPQDLAFDDLGHLVTGDNNSDSEDKARIVYVVEGGETGWRMNFQYKPKRGPWVREGWWKPRFEDQAAFLIPPLANLGSGPSGLIHNPGGVLSPRHDNEFYLCDFLGSRKHSGVRSFRLEAEGAGLKMVENGWLVKGFLPTDLDFGPKGELFLCDWVSGWTGPGRGRVYAIRDEVALDDDASREAAALMSRPDLKGLATPRLEVLLGHPDRRLRQRAQFALVAAGDPGRKCLLRAAADRERSRLARVHAIWGLGQLGRSDAGLAAPLLALLEDADAEIRAQSARVLAEVESDLALSKLETLLGDPSARARYFAAMALGAHDADQSFDAVLAMLAENDDRDLYLRHAGVMALTRMGDADRLASDAVAGHPSRAVRLAALLALRRLGDARLARFLDDQVPFIAVEAARAIHDQPLAAAWPALAAQLDADRSRELGEPFLRRVISARDLLSRPEDAVALARFAADDRAPMAMRAEALAALGSWTESPLQDRVLKDHRPRPPRTQGDLRLALEPQLEALFAVRSKDMREALAEALAHADIKSAAAQLSSWLEDPQLARSVAKAALDAVDRLDEGHFVAACRAALKSRDGGVRGHAARLLARRDPALALPVLESALARQEVAECQLIYRTLGEMKCEEADLLLARDFEHMSAGEIMPGVQLELLQALEARAEDAVAPLQALLAARRAKLEARSVRQPLAEWEILLHGGDAARGKKTFEASKSDCRRCHAVTAIEKPMAGPNLRDVGQIRGRSYLLESIVAPNRSIHPDFQQVVVETRDGRILVGRLLESSTAGLAIEINHDDKRFERIDLSKEEIASQRSTQSAMPADITKRLSRAEIRDLVAYLLTLKGD